MNEWNISPISQPLLSRKSEAEALSWLSAGAAFGRTPSLHTEPTAKGALLLSHRPQAKMALRHLHYLETREPAGRYSAPSVWKGLQQIAVEALTLYSPLQTTLKGSNTGGHDAPAGAVPRAEQSGAGGTIKTQPASWSCSREGFFQLNPAFTHPLFATLFALQSI